MKGLSLMNNKERTMSSREIAELTGKHHRSVLSDIRNVLGQAGIDGKRFESIYLDKYKREKPCYNLPRLECDLIVSGYSVKYRLAIISRWHELEAQQQFSLPTHSQALRMLADELDAHSETKAIVAELKPQAKSFEALTRVSGIVSVSDYHKLLQSEHGLEAIQKDVRRWLNDEGYIFKRNGEWHRYASHSDKFEEKLVPWSNNRGSSWVVYLTKKGVKTVTPKIVEALR